MQQLEQGCSEPSEGEQDLMRCACKKRITIVEPRATAIVFAASVVRDERMWRRARMWKYDALQISETCLSKDI